MNYRIDSTAKPFERAIPRGLHAITAVTGIQFIRTTGPADVEYLMHPKFKEGYDGLYDDVTHRVWLTDVFPTMRLWIVEHESMHFLGAAHSEAGNVMESPLTLIPQGFGVDDLATLNYIAIQNGCDPNE